MPIGANRVPKGPGLAWALDLHRYKPFEFWFLKAKGLWCQCTVTCSIIVIAIYKMWYIDYQMQINILCELPDSACERCRSRVGPRLLRDWRKIERELTFLRACDIYALYYSVYIAMFLRLFSTLYTYITLHYFHMPRNPHSFVVVNSANSKLNGG